MSRFDFYREAKFNYRHIVPSREDGLILFYLYEKMEKGDYANDEFTETEIVTAIEYVYADVKGDLLKRNEYERNNDIILRLQEFFLWRNEKKKVYSFKSYGIEFCKNIKTQLQQFYSPTEIKAIFDSLVHELKIGEQNEEQFAHWMKIHFDKRSPDLARQIEILDQQVGDAVKTFRAGIIAADNDVNQIIADALDSLKIIKTSSDEFRNAFHGTYEIEESLLHIQESTVLTDETSLKIRRVREFIRKIRSNLELVSKRIDQIQPRIREFIHDFNQRDFDRKTELFLKYLLKLYIKNKEISPDILQKVIRQDVPVFSILLKRNIGLSRPVEIPLREINSQKRELSLASLQKKQFIRRQVLFWIGEVQKMIDKYNELYFTKVFFEILRREKEYQLTIAVKVSHKIVLKYCRHPSYTVKIDKDIVTDDTYNNITAWKMYIKKKMMIVMPS